MSGPHVMVKSRPHAVNVVFLRDRKLQLGQMVDLIVDGRDRTGVVIGLTPRRAIVAITTNSRDNS